MECNGFLLKISGNMVVANSSGKNHRWRPCYTHAFEVMVFRFSLRTVLVSTAFFSVWLAACGTSGVASWLIGSVLLLIGLAIHRLWQYGVAIACFVSLALLLNLVFPLLWEPAAIARAVAFSMPLTLPYLLREQTLPAWSIAMLGFMALLAVSTIHSHSDPRGPYYKAYLSVMPGMTVDEVRRAFRDTMGDSQPDGFLFEHTADSDVIWTTLDDNDGRYNAELIEIRLKDDRVVSKRYLPD